MYFYRKLQGLNHNSTFMKMFYSCFIESVLIFYFVSWYGLLSLKNKDRPQGIVKVCSKIEGTTLKYLPLLYKVRSLRKAQSILADLCHPHLKEFKLLPSGHWYNLPRFRSNLHCAEVQPHRAASITLTLCLERMQRIFYRLNTKSTERCNYWQCFNFSRKKLCISQYIMTLLHKLT